MAPTLLSGCNSCDVVCEPPRTLDPSKAATESGPKVGDYEDLLVDVRDVLRIVAPSEGRAYVEGPDDVLEAVELFVRTGSFRGDWASTYRAYLKGVECTEYIAIYCPSRDVIYYNVDRIAKWVTGLYLANLGTFLKQLGRGLGDKLNSVEELGIPFDLVKAVAAEVTRDVSLAYLFAHERYHWAGGPWNERDDEEALATAFGLYSAYEYLLATAFPGVSTTPSGKRGRRGSGQANGPIRLEVDMSGMTSRDLSAFKDYILSDALAAYFGHLTLARLYFDHLHMPEYSGFVKYLSNAVRPPQLVVEPIPLGILFETGMRVRSGGAETVTYKIRIEGPYSAHVALEKGGGKDLEFKGGLRSRKRELREKYKFCERILSLGPGAWLVDARSIADGKYFVED